MHSNPPALRTRGQHKARWSTEGSAAASCARIEHPGTLFLIDTQPVGMPVDDGACIRVALPQFGVALDHGVDPMTVLDHEPPTGEIQYRAFAQRCNLAPLLFRPLRGHIIVAEDGGNGTPRLLQLPKNLSATDIAGVQNAVTVLRNPQYPVIKMAVGV